MTEQSPDLLLEPVKASGSAEPEDHVCSCHSHQGNCLLQTVTRVLGTSVSEMESRHGNSGFMRLVLGATGGSEQPRVDKGRIEGHSVVGLCRSNWSGAGLRRLAPSKGIP